MFIFMLMQSYSVDKKEKKKKTKHWNEPLWWSSPRYSRQPDKVTRTGYQKTWERTLLTGVLNHTQRRMIPVRDSFSQ